MSSVFGKPRRAKKIDSSFVSARRSFFRGKKYGKYDGITVVSSDTNKKYGS